MANHGFRRGVFGFILVTSCALLTAQEEDTLTLPREVRLNKRQPPDVVLKTIGIEPGMVIGEVGAGRGRYTVQIASRIGPTGRIYANDIRQEALRSIDKRAADLGMTNIDTVLGSVTETNLPDGAMEMVIMVNVVHCLEEPVALLRNVSKALKPDGQIVIVEGNLDKEPSTAGEWFSRSKLLKIYEDAGYDLVREETFLPSDNIYFLKEKPESQT
jgi:ubiquinone/menaquinone biosynthesis C-methylase UbiE